MSMGLNNCPSCGGTEEMDAVHVIDNYHIDTGCTRHSVLCEECGFATPEFDTVGRAVAIWNRSAFRAERKAGKQWKN